MKKTLLITASSLIGAVVIAMGINYFYVENKMTKSYTHANTKAVIVESSETMVNATPAIVLDTLSDIGKWPEWNTSVSDAKMDGNFAPGATFSWATKSGTITSQVKVVQKNNVVWVGKTLGIFAIHSWTFEEVNGKTKVTSQESWEGLTAFILQASLRGELNNSLDVTLHDLKTAAEKQSAE